MGLTNRIGVGAPVLTLAVIVAATAAIPSAGAASPARGPVPLAGDWEGSGPHGLPLSFALARRGGRLVATSIALGAPSVCPADARDAKAVALSDVAYAGPGGRSPARGPSPASALLSGRIPRHAARAALTGGFTGPRAGHFSIQVRSDVGCGWPRQTLAWTVHRGTRRRVPDGIWSAQLSGPGITPGSVRIAVAGGGRVIESFSSSFRCETRTEVGNSSLDVTPAYEFIRPDGSFYSPLAGNSIRGHRTLWSGRFTAAHALTGTLTVYDSCTRQLVRAAFRGRLAKPAQGVGTGST